MKGKSVFLSLLSIAFLCSSHVNAFSIKTQSSFVVSTLSQQHTTSSSVTSNNMIPIGVEEAVSSSMVLAETEAWVQPTAAILDPVLNILSFAMLCRVVISWYPQTNVNEAPFNFVVWPTEPLLKVTRNVVPPAFGVDISPIVWLGIFTFLHEIFLGQQGLFTLKLKYGI